MAEEQARQEGVADNELIIQPWVRSLLDRLLVAHTLIGSALMAVVLAKNTSFAPGVVVIGGFIAPQIVITICTFLRAHLSHQARAAIWLAMMSIQACTSLARVGFLPGPFLLMFLIVMVAGLLLHARAAVAVLIGSAIGVVIMGYGMSTGYIQPPNAVDVSMTIFGNWIRIAVIYLGIGTMFTATVINAVRRIQYSLKEAERANEKLREEQQERERAIQEREEAERAMLHAQKMESLGQMASQLAHDFNNILTVFMFWSEVLADYEDPSLREAATEIAEATSHGASLTRQLMDIGRKNSTEPERVDLEPFIGQFTRVLRHFLDLDIAVDLQVPAGSAVWIESAALQQALLNLAINANDAINEHRAGEALEEGEAPGTLTLIIERMERPDEGPVSTIHTDEVVAIRVSDDGPGMPEEVAAQVFDPFFTTKAPGEGTGLGLASVKSVVHRAGGVIELNTVTDVGTVFTLWLPIFMEGLSERTDEVQEAARVVAPEEPAVSRTAGAPLSPEEELQQFMDQLDEISEAMEEDPSRVGAA